MLLHSLHWRTIAGNLILDEELCEGIEEEGGVLVMDGHDHLSPVLALSSGVWGEDLFAWIGSF